MSSRNFDLASLLLRLAFGLFMIIGHGWPKLLRFFGDEPIGFRDPFGLGPEVSLALVVFAEVLCAALLMAGLFTRWVTLPLIFAMLVAFFVAHFDDPFAKQEKALLYLFGYLGILLLGPGRYSIDHWWGQRKLF